MKTAASVLVAMSIAFALCGCASDREIHAADGSMVYAIDCYAQSVQACKEKAGEVCGVLGYHFVNPDGERVPAEAVLNPPPEETKPSTPSSPSAPVDPKSASTARTPAASGNGSSGGEFTKAIATFWHNFKFDRKLYIECRA